MLKELFESIIETGRRQAGITFYDAGGVQFSNKKMEPIPPNPVPTLKLASLSGLVDFIKANRDGIALADALLTVDSFEHVNLRGKVIGPTLRRELFVEVNAPEVEAFEFAAFDDLESFSIDVQTKFVADAERMRLLALAASITSGPIRTVVDDGVSQEVTLKAGVTMKASQEVRNPFQLKPFRTFSEIDQPASPFIFRLQKSRDDQPPNAALFEADGGAWRIAAMASIRDYLRKALPELAGQIIG